MQSLSFHLGIFKFCQYAEKYIWNEEQNSLCLL